MVDRDIIDYKYELKEFFVKLKDKIIAKYFSTFQSLDSQAKAQISSGFQFVGVALLLIGVFLTTYSLIVGGGVATFGVGMILTARILFK